MKKHILNFLISLIYINAICQLHPEHKRTWNWHFGSGVGLNFSSGHLALNNIASPTGTGYGNSTISDTAGNLLLYCNGSTVFDLNLNSLQPNYGTVMGGMDAPLGTLILPVPHNDSIFIVFGNTGDPVQANMDLYYSLVNLNGNNGLGYIYQPSTLLLPHSGGSVAAAYHKNATDFWIVSADTNGFLHSWLLDSSITLQHVCSIQIANVKSLYGETIGHLTTVFTPKPSADLIAISCGGTQGVHSSFSFTLINFDNVTGCFSNEIIVESGYGPCQDGNCFSYVPCFSPQGKYVYVPFFECPWSAPRNGYIKRYTNIYSISSASDVQVDTVFSSTTGEGPYTIMYTPVNTMLFFNINDSNPTSLNNPYLSQILYPDSTNPVVLSNSIYSERISTFTPINNLPAAWYYKPEGYLNIPELNNEPVVVFPNPVNDKLYLLNLYQPVINAVFYDLLGKKHLTEFNSTGEISTTNFCNGIYLLEITLNNGLTKTTKILVQH